jgi:hypothetical protein
MQTSPSLPHMRGSGSFGKNFFPSNSPGFVMKKSATMDVSKEAQKQMNRRSMVSTYFSYISLVLTDINHLAREYLHCAYIDMLDRYGEPIVNVGSNRNMTACKPEKKL